MNFIVYDIIFLVLFTLVTILFLYRRRKNLQRQGLLYLYHTKLGIKIIDSTEKRFSKALNYIQYIAIACGYALMALILVGFFKLSYTYLTSATLAKELKVPLVMPLIPYIDTIFKIDFLPPFYFTYWIIIIAIIAIPHEFAHGIFARLHKIKIKSTGFGFLGPFLAAFVEPDEKHMEKSKKLSQLSILAAGTFANVLTAIFFTIIIWIFFFAFFSASGVYFSTYATTSVNFTDITSINDVSVHSPEEIPLLFRLSNSSIIPIKSDKELYFVPYEILSYSISQNLSYVYAYENSPAYRANLSGAISEIDGTKLKTYSDLKQVLASKQPGDSISIKTNTNGQIKDYQITLAEREGKPFLGIGRIDMSLSQKKGIISSISGSFYKMIDPLRYKNAFDGVSYQSTIGGLGLFIYNLLWWLILISMSVALVNMLPLGLFDGGRFFLVTVWGITGSKKAGEYAFRISTWLLLVLVALWMVKWLFAIF